MLIDNFLYDFFVANKSHFQGRPTTVSFKLGKEYNPIKYDNSRTK